MDRREFVKGSLIMAGGALLPINGAGSTPPENWKIEYIREKIPEFDIPPYRGARYEDLVPDTLDIAERAKLGVRGLTEITDPNADCEIYCAIDFSRKPPVMAHEFGDWCQNVEGMIESLPLLRIATGSDLNSHVDRIWMEGLLKSVGPDGLIYYPLNGTPWARLGCVWLSPVWKADGSSTDASDKSVAQITNPGLWPRAIAAMSIYYQRDKNPMWKQTIERLVQGMSALASDEGGYAFFPAGAYEPNRKFPGSRGAAELVMPIGYLALDGGNSRAIQGLAQYYRLTGYEPARVLAQKLVNFIRYRSDAFDEEGRFRFSSYERSGAEVLAKYSREHGGQVTAEEIRGQRLGGHFHGHAIGILPMTEYGVTVGDRELLEWCKSSFEWAKDQSSSLVGFFPELIVPGYPSCESCAVADMIGIAAKLTRAGAGDYWDDLDRWTRNQFAENQLTEGEWFYGLAQTAPKKPIAFNETADHVVERSLGGFAGSASGNEWTLRNDGPWACCTGNSTRALYYIWDNIIESKGDEFRVNMLLNRASACADVYSFIPYDGRVNVKMKQPCLRVLVRVPEWVESGSPQVVCKVNGSVRQLVWEGRYVNVGAAKQGETIDLGFPITTRTVKETIGTVRYSLEIKGNTVISIDPRGKCGALYKRQQYRADHASWRKVQRFAPEAPPSW